MRTLDGALPPSFVEVEGDGLPVSTADSCLAWGAVKRPVLDEEEELGLATTGLEMVVVVVELDTGEPQKPALFHMPPRHWAP